MPRYSAIFALVIFAAAAFADVVPTVQWDVETGRLTPVPYALSIRRGESVNIQPRFLSYNSPMVLTGSTVQLRYWYTGQTGYYATTGSLMAATGRVHVAWYDALCPASNALNYEVRVTIGTNVLARGYGPLSLLTGTSGTETNGQVRTSINWSMIDQTGGPAVLSNQMGSGATWSGSAWTFAAADMSWSNDYYRVSNPSNYAPASVTNGLYPSSNPSNYVTAGVTNGLLPAAATNGWEVGSHTDLLPTVATNGAEWGSHAGLATLAQATGAAQAVVAPWTNQVTAASVAAAGGLTNRVYNTPTALDCSPTTTITRAMIDAAPWGEMSLALTQACYLTFDATVTGTTDAATFALYITGTNPLTWNTNMLTGSAWTNATSAGSDRIFRKAARAGTVAIW